MALHDEGHASHRVGSLRAMVLGANDGIVSIACLVLGVAASDASRNAILTAGIAGLVAGAASMALGEYVSVSSQRDSELSDIAKETWELENTPERELAELTAIYQDKGLGHDLARQVAVELTKKDALKVHLAEELGITEHNRARPVQAAVTSAIAFVLGGAMPVVAVAVGSTTAVRIWFTLAVSIAALVTLGSVGAHYGKASKRVSVRRIVIGGIVAMAFTMLVGKIFGAAVN
jgi:VIT1/CCC1 family predicted Fe2+/Mn2+ transporter